MVRVNGMNPDRNKRVCRLCGAKLERKGDDESCPNIKRNDHQGKPYHGRVREL